MLQTAARSPHTPQGLPPWQEEWGPEKKESVSLRCGLGGPCHRSALPEGYPRRTLGTSRLLSAFLRFGLPPRRNLMVNNLPLSMLNPRGLRQLSWSEHSYEKSDCLSRA
jgi:hypothetical protein